MNPYVLELLAKMRVAELHRQAEQDRLASLATRAAKARRKPSDTGFPWLSALRGGGDGGAKAARPVVGRRRPA